MRLFEEAVREKSLALLTLTVSASATPEGRYRHWDKIRRLSPPAGLTKEQHWATIKSKRRSLFRSIPLRDLKGNWFQYALVDPLLHGLSYLDQRLARRIGVPDPILNPETRDRYLITSLMEEAIASSQLEGAATTREVAKEMIRSGRDPRDRGERMALSNFKTMRELQRVQGEPLTPDLVLDIHRQVTEGTLDEERGWGRLRRANEPVVVAAEDDTVLHRPPPADELPERLSRMCAFANETMDLPPEKGFLHPIVRAIVLHFWLAYDHPFLDGNGRTARALFYWSMLRQGYWLCEYLSISRAVRRAPGKYRRSFLYTETDENDLTYFLLEQVRVLRLALEDLDTYLQRKTAEIRETERLLRRSRPFNHRQVALLSHALRHPDAEYTFQSHRMSHDVVYQTARTDLLSLARRGILLPRRVGKALVFRPAAKLERKLQKLS